MMTGMIFVAFRRETGRGLWSRLVHLVAGPPVHCVLVTWDGVDEVWRGFHATAGVGVEPIALSRIDVQVGRWDIVPTSVQGDEATALALAFCARRVGSRYDYLGAVLYGTPMTTRDRWTCSELCAEALVHAGAPLALLDAGRTPRRLLRALRPT